MKGGAAHPERMDHHDPTDLRGLWVPLITPFDRADHVDVGALSRLAARLLDDGARGLVALGTTGEPSVLDVAEQRQVVDSCAAVCSQLGRPLMVGAGTNSTRTTVAAVQGLDGVPEVAAALVVVPYYTRPTPDAVVEHYRVVAAESPVPIVAYNVPYRTGRGLDAEHLLAVAAIDNVVGVKQAVGALDGDTLRLLGEAPPGFHVFAGDDAFVVPTILMGGHGAIAAAAHVCTPAFATMVQAASCGDVTRARRLARALLPVVMAGFAEPNPAVWKAALARAGEIATDQLRSPMTPASLAATDDLLAAIASVSG
jgi:4-hydroxy-tetrahydrodipicolinate synthase